MPNTIAYAQKYSKELDQALTQGMLTAELETPKVDWLDAKTFHVPSLSVSGFKIIHAKAVTTKVTSLKLISLTLLRLTVTLSYSLMTLTLTNQTK